ncbi:hypothetical protein [Streptomyces natalensis]|uniref:hypothetical protein n=1 Tax=Streptomyces natalensis TaxID=68242 RepID=UPI000A74EC00|nr:hypothetical protein [Streptomyces natalensis]
MGRSDLRTNGRTAHGCLGNRERQVALEWRPAGPGVLGLHRLVVADEAAPPGDGSWEVTESKDPWGDPECTVQRGDLRLSPTVMKTPLKAHLWWGLGTFSLTHDLPGMIKANRDRLDGWLHLPQCRHNW